MSSDFIFKMHTFIFLTVPILSPLPVINFFQLLGLEPSCLQTTRSVFYLSHSDSGAISLSRPHFKVYNDFVTFK